jgi:uncharacterized protein YhaN
MIIEKIVIKSFGLINDMTLEFSNKINVIEGQNEAGKSTIAAFIKYMLYGFDTLDNGECSERKKRISWTTGTAQGSMYVKVKDKRYLITRSTTPSDSSDRTTYREESSIVDLETGSPAFGKMCAGDVFFKVDRDLFENTAFIGQIGDSSFNEGQVRESIENIIFSGNEQINNQRAMNRISEKMEALLHQNGGGGAIYDLLKRESELEDKLDECNDDNRRILIKESELHKIRETRAAAENKQEKLHELDACYRNVMLIQNFDELHALEEEADRRAETYNNYVEENTRAGFVPDEGYLTDLAVARRGVTEAYHAMGEAREVYAEQRGTVGITREIESAIELADDEGGEANILSRAAAFFKNAAFGTACTIIGGLFVIASIVLFVLADKPLDYILPSIMGVLSLALAGYFGYSLFTNFRALKSVEKKFATETYGDLKGKIAVIREARVKRDTLANATEGARVALERAKERYEQSKEDLIALILKWGEEPPASDLDQFLDELEAKVRAFLDEKNRLFDEKISIDITVREIRRTLADKSEVDIRAQVSPLKRKALAGINHDGIINGISEARTVIAEQDRLAFEAENELMMLKSRAGDPGEYYSRINSIAKRREELQDKHKAYYIALRAIDSATENLRREISPRLGEYATKLMSVMTNKKYESFAIDNDLRVTFKGVDGDDKSVDFLSGGTRDLAYIATRAALIDMLYSEKPPIIFDESFAHQDNVRAASMMRGIANLAKEGCQSFIFTCRGREGTIAKETVKSAAVFKILTEDEKSAE